MNRSLVLFLFSLAFMISIACTKKTEAPPATPPPTQQPAEPISHDCMAGWPCEWDDAVMSSVGAKQLDISAERIKYYCPKWGTLTGGQKKMFWRNFWWAVAKYESSRNPKTMYWEKTQGTDKITGLIVTSDGLLQLSYADSEWAKCGFDFKKDKDAHTADVKSKPTGKPSWLSTHDKTINDPMLNLKCANNIANYHLTKSTTKTLRDVLGAYWAAIRDHGEDLLAELRIRDDVCGL